MTRSTLDTGMTRTLPDDTAQPPHGLVICKGCNRWVDPNVCHCGESIAAVVVGHEGHPIVSMGCDCHRVKP